MARNPGPGAWPIRFPARAAVWYPDQPSALYGHTALRLRSRPCSRQQQQDGGRVEHQCNHEPSQDRLVVGAKQARQIPHRTKVGFDDAAAFSIFKSARAFASTVRLSARLLSFACRRSSSAARSLEIGDVLKVMARTERRWGRREKVARASHTHCFAERQNVGSCRRTSALVGG